MPIGADWMKTGERVIAELLPVLRLRKDQTRQIKRSFSISGQTMVDSADGFRRARDARKLPGHMALSPRKIYGTLPAGPKTSRPVELRAAPWRDVSTIASCRRALLAWETGTGRR
jgi:hypothetical protein